MPTVLSSSVSPSELQRVDYGGWMFWKDSLHTEASPQVVTSGTRTLFTVDGLHSSTVTSYRNLIPENLFSGSAMWPPSAGESYTVRLDLSIVRNSVSQNEYMDVVLDIGDQTPLEIVSHRVDLVRGSGNVHDITLVFPVFTAAPFVNNGGRFYMTPTDEVEVYSKAILLRREYAP